MNPAIKRLLPNNMADRIAPAWRNFRRNRIRFYQRAANLAGLNFSKRRDYYSVLPVLEDLYRNEARWNKPSSLAGVRYDVGAMRELFDQLLREHAGPLLPPDEYDRISARLFGPGYPRVDAIVSYAMLRKLKPKRYFEVGSGLSTYIAHLAGQANAVEGHPLEITCVEPYPSDALRTLTGVTTIVDKVQNVPPERFAALEAGDVFFIDSTHVVAIDSDVAYLFMELVPRVAKGVWVHIHDVPFPYNIPFPASHWTLGDRWPIFWQEAMLVQAFLAFNDAFTIRMSVPLLRQTDEALIVERIPDYQPVAADRNPPSALWIERVG